MNTAVVDTSVLEAGIAEADKLASDMIEKQRLRQEESQVKWWFSQIDTSRGEDKPVREGYARDRIAAKCLTAHEVRVPLIGTSIDTMRSFLYARDPSVDCVPAEEVEAPNDPMPAPPEPPAGLGALMQDPSAAVTVPGAIDGLAAGGVQGAAMAVGADVARQVDEYQQAQALYNQQLAEWRDKELKKRVRKRERMLFARTMEIAITKAWKKAQMKSRARKAVVSTLTVGIGWAKVSWQERTFTDSITQKKINDLRALLNRVEGERMELEEGYCSVEDQERIRLTIQQQLAAAQKGAVEILTRGLAIDIVPAQNMQLPSGTPIMEYLSGPWMCEFIYRKFGDIRSMFPDLPADKLASAQRYHKVEPKKAPNDASQDPAQTMRAEDADSFIVAGTGTLRVNATPSDEDYVQIAEVWSADDQNIYTMIRGVPCYPKPPEPPNTQSERFYGYFGLAFIEEDEERSPASMTSRSSNLQDEYNGRRSALKVSRHRAKPAVFFDETAISAETMAKIARSESQEYVGVPTVGGKPIGDCFTAKPVSPIIPELYDTSPILRDFERVWGTQEALSGSVEVDKTATEADIQQTGFRSRTGDMRDQLEEWLSDIAQYSGVILKTHLTIADVAAWCGPNAVWPELDDGETIEDLMSVSIRAGSTGKPNSAKEREAWAAVVDPMMKGAQAIGAARGASPQEVADKMEAILEETANRAGDNAIDITKFIPQNEGMLSAPSPGQAPAPGAVPTEQPALQPQTNLSPASEVLPPSPPEIPQ